MKKNNEKIQIGQVYGYWKVVEKDSTKTYHHICICLGCNLVKKSVRNNLLKQGRTKSCGCKQAELMLETTYSKYTKQELQQKYQKTMLEKYGVENPSQVAKFKDKKKQTWLEKYQVDNPQKSLQIKQKTKQTNLEKYGFEVASKSLEVKQKTKQTNLEKYGCNYTSQNLTIRAKQLKTKKQKYGVENLFSSKKFQGQLRKLREENMITLSTGELFIDFCDSRQIKRENAYKIYNTYGEQGLLDYATNYDQHIFSTEQRLIKILEDYFPNLTKYGKHPKEFSFNRFPDFRLEKNQKVLYLNIDGLFWHSEKSKHSLICNNKSYHLDLAKKFKQNNQVIFQFREDELINSPSIVKSIILNYLGLSLKIYARKCQIKFVDQSTADQFLKNNHLMGPIRGRHKGLFYKGELICLMTVKRKNNGIDISRFCCKIETSIVGGFSKLLKSFVKELSPEFIQSYLDLRYSTGKSYHANGFIEDRTHLSWKWTDGKNTFNRLRCRANMDSRNLTQAEHAKELGWYKIYDAGQSRYVKYLNTNTNTNN